jgi:hypothetical protein
MIQYIFGQIMPSTNSDEGIICSNMYGVSQCCLFVILNQGIQINSPSKSLSNSVSPFLKIHRIPKTDTTVSSSGGGRSEALSSPNWLPNSLSFHTFEVLCNRIDHSPEAPLVQKGVSGKIWDRRDDVILGNLMGEVAIMVIVRLRYYIKLWGSLQSEL